MKRWSLALVCLLIGALAGAFIAGPFLSVQGAPKNTTRHAVTLPRELTSYRDVVKKVLPAVVSIEMQVKVKKVNRPRKQPGAKGGQPGFDDSRIPEEFRKFFKDMEKRQFEFPEPTPQSGFGSGFIVDPKGVILTNYHVVGGADRLVVTLRDGRTFVTRDIHGDRKTDLAIVRIDPKTQDLPSLELGNSDAMEIGDRVLAVGAPFGLTGSVTAGIVSAKGRNGLHMNMYEDFIQTDAAINPGNSGGPLVNLEGKVIGINAAIKTRSGGFQGVGLAVASNLAKSIMKALLKDGVVHRGYLGVQIKDLSPEVGERLGLGKQKGVLVAQVFPKSPAAKAGLKAGDVIVRLGGKKVQEGRVLQTVVAGLPLQKSVPLTVVRDGQKQTLRVVIEEQPEQFDNTGNFQKPAPSRGEEGPVTVDKFGVKVKDLNAETAEELGYPKDAKGALVTQVDPDGPGATAGLRKGMLIVKVDKKKVASAAAVRKALKKGSLKKGVLVQVQTPQGGTDYLVFKAETVK
jgi:serine protease Do